MRRAFLFGFGWYAIISAVAMWVAAVSIAAAQESRSPFSPCFEIIPSGSGWAPIKINKCTGETWLLTKIRISDQKSAATYAYRWSPLASEQSENSFTTSQ